MVGNRSQLYQEHPDWVVRDALTGGPLVQMQFYGEFRWHKRSEEYYILDTTRSEAFDYLRKVFRTWRWQWGCEYFKTDFMYFSAHYGPDRAVWHQTGLTRIEIWCRTAEMIRQEIGEALWLGCGCPLWAAIGLVDGIRIGRDMGVKWKGDLSAESLLHDQATRNFTNNIFWQTDPDCVLLRQRFHHLTDSEVRSLAIFAGMAGGVLMTSDDLSELSPERLRLWKLLLPKSSSACRFPLLSQSALSYEHRAAGSEIHRARRAALFFDPVLVQVRSLEQGQHAVFIFNTGEAPTQRTLLLNALALPDSCYVHDWIRNKTWPEKVEALHVSLAAHDGALFFLSVQPFEKIPETLG